MTPTLAPLVVAAVVATGACGSGASDERAGGDTRLRVLAAASLSDVLTQLTTAFERGRDGVEVELSFGASSALARQVHEGADADVLITADEATMDLVRSSDAVTGEPAVIARNRLTILVEEGNPEGIRSLADLARPGLVVVLCAPEVPCGRLARSLLAAEGVEVDAASLEENVKGVVSKVTLGEADAGIVYATDARVAGGAADAIDVPVAAGERFAAAYPAGVLARSAHRSDARAFVEFLSGPTAREALRAAGFLDP